VGCGGGAAYVLRRRRLQRAEQRCRREPAVVSTNPARRLIANPLPTRAPPQVNKEDLLNMVRYGAELVFSSEASNITGERRTRTRPASLLARSSASTAIKHRTATLHLSDCTPNVPSTDTPSLLRPTPITPTPSTQPQPHPRRRHRGHHCKG